MQHLPKPAVLLGEPYGHASTVLSSPYLMS